MWLAAFQPNGNPGDLLHCVLLIDEGDGCPWPHAEVIDSTRRIITGTDTGTVSVQLNRQISTLGDNLMKTLRTTRTLSQTDSDSSGPDILL